LNSSLKEFFHLLGCIPYVGLVAAWLGDISQGDGTGVVSFYLAAF
jgi:hypothetical protein